MIALVRTFVVGTLIMLAAQLCVLATDPAPVSPAPIPTPQAGTAQPLPQPTVNPVQFNFTPGSVGSSSAINSNFFKVYGDLTAVTSMLNGCSYIPGAAIGAVTALSPITISIAPCSAGTGIGTTATIGLSGTLPATNFSGIVGANAGLVVSGGQLLATGNGTVTTYVPPLFLANGTNVSPNAHSVVGGCGFAGNTCTVSFAGSATWTAASTYACFASYSAGIASAANDSLSIDQQTATSMRIVNAGTSGGTSYTGNVTFACTGY